MSRHIVIPSNNQAVQDIDEKANSDGRFPVQLWRQRRLCIQHPPVHDHPGGQGALCQGGRRQLRGERREPGQSQGRRPGRDVVDHQSARASATRSARPMASSSRRSGPNTFTSSRMTTMAPRSIRQRPDEHVGVQCRHRGAESELWHPWRRRDRHARRRLVDLRRFRDRGRLRSVRHLHAPRRVPRSSEPRHGDGETFRSCTRHGSWWGHAPVLRCLVGLGRPRGRPMRNCQGRMAPSRRRRRRAHGDGFGRPARRRCGRLPGQRLGPGGALGRRQGGRPQRPGPGPSVGNPEQGS